jgi:hypothetical protein
MLRNQQQASVSKTLIAVLILLNTIFLEFAYEKNEKYFWALLISLPLLVFSLWHQGKK